MEVSSHVKADDMSEKQLKQMLADHRLRHEQSLLGDSATYILRAEDNGVPAVGSTLLLDVSINKVSLSKQQLTLVPHLLFYHILPSMRSDVT